VNATVPQAARPTRKRNNEKVIAVKIATADELLTAEVPSETGEVPPDAQFSAPLDNARLRAEYRRIAGEQAAPRGGTLRGVRRGGH